MDPKRFIKDGGRYLVTFERLSDGRLHLKVKEMETEQVFFIVYPPYDPTRPFDGDMPKAMEATRPLPLHKEAYRLMVFDRSDYQKPSSDLGSDGYLHFRNLEVRLLPASE